MLRLVDIDFEEQVFNEEKDLEVCYFEMTEDIEMSDGVVFETGTKLIQLTKLDKDVQFFAEAPDYGPSYLWVNASDAKLKEKVVETWTPEMFRVKKKLIVNDFL